MSTLNSSGPLAHGSSEDYHLSSIGGMWMEFGCSVITIIHASKPN